MTTTVANLKFGTAAATLGGTDLGTSVGEISIEVTTSTFDMVADHLGDQAADVSIVGRSAMVRFPAGEVTLENINRFLAGSTLVTDAMDSTKKKVLGDQAVGQRAIGDSLASALVLKPLDGADTPTTDANEWFTAWKAFPIGNPSLSYGLNNQRVWTVEFKCLPDASNGNRPFAFGDTTAAS